MRWTEQSPALPLQALASLAVRAPDLDALLRAIAPDDGLLVAVSGAASEAVTRHLAAHEHEQGGLLLGEVYAEGNAAARSRVVLVTEAVPAQDFASSRVSLRMASGLWEEARRRLAAPQMIVGWYHSHPGLGAFFSDTDRRTQRAFFPHAYSLGWVIDPLRRESAWFVGPDSSSPARVAYGLPDGDDPAAGGAVAGAGAAGDEAGGCRNGGGPTTSIRFTK